MARQPINTSVEQHRIIDTLAEYLGQQEGVGISHASFVTRSAKFWIDNDPVFADIKDTIEWPS